VNYPTENPLLVFAISVIALWLSAWAGWSYRRRHGTLDDEMREDFGFILAATLTLLGLIIGFSFSMATSRYDQRKNYEEAEANAIGTEYVRADLLPDADAARVRELLRKYLNERVLFYKAHDEQEIQQINARTVDINQPFDVALLASNDGKLSQGLPYASVRVDGLAADETTSVDIRLPIGAMSMASNGGKAAPYAYVHTIIDSQRELVETDKTNNLSVDSREEIATLAE
jgi:hypothetical protein